MLSSESVMASPLCLPSLVQPNPNNLGGIVQTTSLGGTSGGRRGGTATGRLRTSRQRPRTCPESTASAQGEELLDLLAQKVRGGQSSVLRQAFKAFDSRGDGSVTRDALYRILCNLLSGVPRKQFNQLLSQLGLEEYKNISFDQFYSSLTGSSVRPRPQTTYLPLRGECGGWSEMVEKILERCKKMDTFKSGKLTMDVLRSVLCDSGVPLTPQQMMELCGDLGYREGQLVSYTHLLSHFTARGKSGLLHSKLTDRHLRFHVNEPKRVCTSVGDAQTRLVTLLNSQFLKLLSDFKKEDRKGSGYVPRAVFQSVLEGHSADRADVERVTQSLCEGSDWVPYPKFLALFEHAPTPITPPLPTPHSHHSNIDQLVAKIRKVVTTQGSEVTEVFQTLDPSNTGRLTVGVAKDLLERFGVLCEAVDLEAVWVRLLRNKDTTVQFTEFVRQFTSRSNTAEGRHLTEDHCFMMSKNLHRDEDMVLSTLRSTLRHYQVPLLHRLLPLDPHRSGFVPKHKFLECVTLECRELSSDQLDLLAQRLDERVPYRVLLPPPNRNPYRYGNNMGYILSQRSPGAFANTSPPSVLTARPPYGLSGVKVHLQKQLAKNWRQIRRRFREVDKGRCGCVSVGVFWDVLGECGVELSSEDKFTVLEYLDPTLQGSVDYAHFISALFEQ